MGVGLVLFPISIFFLWPVDFYAIHWEMRLLFWAKLYGALILFGLLAFLLWRVRRGRPVDSAPAAPALS